MTSSGILKFESTFRTLTSVRMHTVSEWGQRGIPRAWSTWIDQIPKSLKLVFGHNVCPKGYQDFEGFLVSEKGEGDSLQVIGPF